MRIFQSFDFANRYRFLNRVQLMNAVRFVFVCLFAHQAAQLNHRHLLNPFYCYKMRAAKIHRAVQFVRHFYAKIQRFYLLLHCCRGCVFQ